MFWPKNAWAQAEPFGGATRATLWRVFYFFKRGNETLQCEVRSEAEGPGYEIVITDSTGTVRVESFPTSDEVYDRWTEIHHGFEREGWWGPATQDGRG